ncbi:hypothetical protein ACLOJK_031160 [Asimina triloba]
MDLDDFRSILREYSVDVWTMIEAAIAVASTDCGSEMKERRDGIVERLYSAPVRRCPNCDVGPRHSGAGAVEVERGKLPSAEKERNDDVRAASPSRMTTRSTDGEDDQEPILEAGDSIDREKNKILVIKEHLEDPSQSEDSLVELLESLAEMDITFAALEETDIGRHVNALRKHSSSEVRRLVKQLVRKWKRSVDEWVKSGETPTTAFLRQNRVRFGLESLIDDVYAAEGDSPQQFAAGKSNPNGSQVPDFGYSPNCQNGSSGSDKYNPPELEIKGKAIPRREMQPKQNLSTPPTSAATSKKDSTDSLVDPERLASARRRLQENYQEAQNAKKQRTIQASSGCDIKEKPAHLDSATIITLIFRSGDSSADGDTVRQASLVVEQSSSGGQKHVKVLMLDKGSPIQQYDWSFDKSNPLHVGECKCGDPHNRGTQYPNCEEEIHLPILFIRCKNASRACESPHDYEAVGYVIIRACPWAPFGQLAQIAYVLYAGKQPACDSEVD